jgi:hypothetical protein
MPDSVEMPAPVRTTICSASRNQLTMGSTSDTAPRYCGGQNERSE